MNVIMISPGFPAEQPLFARGLAQVGAKVIGLGDQHQEALPEVARAALAAYFRVELSDEREVMATVARIAREARIDRVECLWEPYMILAARLREMLGVPGMNVPETIPYRDKEVMKQRLDEAGIRTPRHAGATTEAGVRAGAAAVGYPLIVKPIDGAGSADTYRVDSDEDLERILPRVRHVSEVTIEEFIEGDDHSFDTVCVNGEIHYFNLTLYRPRALIARDNEWISPCTVALRDVDLPELQPGREMGEAVLKALRFRTGFTHMEWYRTATGEAVFGEIGARPPGAHTVDIMNYACDIDLYRGWAEATCHGTFSQPVTRKYNAAFIFKRAEGQGRIQRIEGLERLMAELGEAMCVVDLLPVGARRRNWKQTLISDGLVIVRHPDLQTTFHYADRVATELRLYAG